MEKLGLIVGVDNLSLKKLLFVRNQTISVGVGGGSILVGEVNVTMSPLSPTDRTQVTQLNTTMTRSTTSIICAPPVQEY